MVLLGVLAVRLKALNKPLEWDAEKMRFTNIASNEMLRVMTSNNFVVKDGHPHFDKQYTKMNALETAKEYIRHTYREGWKLPEMPG
jgi:hypothetical protein